MQVHKTTVTPTKVKLTIEADQLLLEDTRSQVLRKLAKNVKLQGFRQGKAPLNLIEKNLDPNTYQSEFIDTALNRMYSEALIDQKIRPVAQPNVTIKKFVPFTELEFDAEVEVIGEVKLPDYTKIKLAKKPVEVTAKDVDAVIDNLRIRMSEKKEVDRAAQDGDEVWIDFEGRDAKTNEPVQGADGKDYPLALGSNTFIPGFEPNLIGVKPGEDKEFTLTFPENYGVKALQSKEVTFKVTITKVNEVTKPAVDDEFAAKVGPFKSADELKSDIKKQVTAEREQQNDRDYESDLLSQITEKSDVPVPAALTEEELTRLEREERQNIAYRGQTWQEHLDEEGVTEEEHREKNRPGAEMRVKAGLVLAEIAEKENIEVTPEELQMRIQLLKGQYQDPAMQAELDKPDNQREIASRIMSEKTIDVLVKHATTKPAAKKSAKKD
ncbi:MAG: Trigger factor [Candidatus Saccharibacteria bacterium]|nr:Trigger factor [Candidatus Saccharibacteria bacterium]